MFICSWKRITLLSQALFRPVMTHLNSLNVYIGSVLTDCRVFGKGEWLKKPDWFQTVAWRG